jgi:hypothetical protein
MSNNQGVFVMGICRGVVSEAWERNGRSGINWRLGIAREYQDKWGQSTSDVIQVDVAANAVQKIQQQAAMLKDKPVMIRVVPMGKAGGRNGAFVTLFAPQDSDLLPQPATPAPLKVAQ